MKLIKIALVCLLMVSNPFFGQKINDVDGKSYAVATLNGSQWMTTNLAVKRFKNGEKIMHAQSQEEWTYAATNKKAAWCYYADEDGVDMTTILYNWYAVTDKRGLAPAGTHIPTFNEWSAFANKIGGVYNAGGILKAKSGWETSQHFIVNPANLFNAKPVGSRYIFLDASANWWDGKSKGKYTNFWTTTPFNNDINSAHAHRMGLAYDVDFLINDADGSGESILNAKGNGFSVRCVVDALP
jgi:uncharacterized protein (TIGR02145 family)